jgi:hypothetical protein
MKSRTALSVCCAIASLVTLLPAYPARGAAQGKEPAAKRPVLFDTDLGTDVDDAFALALILASPELELRGVTTVGGGAEDRAWMACRFLTHVGRTDVPVAFGRDPQPASEIDWQIQYRRHPAVVWDRTAKPVKASAVELMYETLKAAAPRKSIIIAAGPLTNVARLLDEHPDSKEFIEMLWATAGAGGRNIPADEKAVRVVADSGVAITLLDGRDDVRLEEPLLDQLFAAGTPLTYQVQSLYELCGEPRPRVHAINPVVLAVSETLPEDARGGPGESPDEHLRWYVDRVAGFGEKVLPKEPGNVSKLVERGNLPARVHVFEDYETDIEKRWWMTGKPEAEDVPPGGGKRCCRAVLTQDYDDLMGDPKATYRAVIFNPVPGPPMGTNTRLSFRYKLTGTDTVRVQLYSLSNGYHRYLSLKGLPQGEWRDGAVDMTQMRRPDGSGGPLSADERIDDIQFYVDPRAELLIDDVVLYDAAPAGEKRPFPKSFVFTGWFDTGEQGKEWPGDFEIVGHEKPLTWDAARSVVNKETGEPWVRLHLRGLRPLPAKSALRFRYRVSDAGEMTVSLVNAKTNQRIDRKAGPLAQGQWSETTVEFDAAGREGLSEVDEIHFVLPKGATLLLDDVLLYVGAGL